jgi:hypothetical protein
MVVTALTEQSAAGPNSHMAIRAEQAPRMLEQGIITSGLLGVMSMADAPGCVTAGNALDFDHDRQDHRPLACLLVNMVAYDILDLMLHGMKVETVVAPSVRGA